MDWDLFDYLVAGTLIGAAGGAIAMAVRRTRSAAYRRAVALAVATGFVIVWANGAVGIIGNESHPANRLFHAVLAVGAVGALAARFRPRGMAGAMVATAVAQAALPLAVWAMGYGWQAPVATVVFAALWLVAASLFRRAAREGA